jgi:hypothetical protein
MIFFQLVVTVALATAAVQASNGEPVMTNLRGSDASAAHGSSDHVEEERRVLAFSNNNSNAGGDHSIVGGTVSPLRPYFVEGFG